MKPPKEYLKNLKHHTITEKMLSDCIYSINNRALNSRDNEYKYTHYIPNTYGNANKYHKKKLEYYQMKKVLLSILEPAHIQKGEVLQRKRTYDYEEGYDCFYIDKYERLDKQNISTEHIDSAFLI